MNWETFVSQYGEAAKTPAGKKLSDVQSMVTYAFIVILILGIGVYAITG